MLFQLTALTVVLFLTEDSTAHNEVYPALQLPSPISHKSIAHIHQKESSKSLVNSNKPPKRQSYKAFPKSTHQILVPQKTVRQLHHVYAEETQTKKTLPSIAEDTEASAVVNSSNHLMKDEVHRISNENEKQLKKELKKSRWKEKVKTKLMNKYKEKQEREDDYQEQMNQLNKLYDLQNPQEEIEDAAHDAEIFRAIYTSVIYHQKTWAARFFKKFTRHRVKRDEEVICYKDLGCFRDEGPFDYLDMLPNSPEEINTMFLLHTKENPTREQLLSYTNITTILNSNFKATRKTKVIIHGFGSSCHRVWVREMRSTFLNMEDLNIICVDWENGAATPNYVRAASNTRLVGTQVAVFLEQMIRATNMSLDDVHLIGFSLGAHVSGYAGQKLKGIGRISGLDPAGPLFESFPPNMRLDASDAKFVDVIHTNADSLLRGGLGAYDPMGHVDFYPNGGRVQKGCKNLFVGGVSDILWPNDGDGRYLCNHRRGYKYFMESVVPVCKFPAVACRDYDTFLKGDCFPCNENCGNMGYYADKSPARGQLFLATRDVEPFCANQYKVEIWHSGGPPTTDSVSTHGRFDITFASHDGKNETINVTRDTGKKMEAGSRTVCIVVLHVALAIIANLHVQYTSYRGWISSGYNRWAIDKMSIMSTSGNIQSFCHRGLTMESGLTMLFPLVPGDCNPLDLTLHPLPVPWPGIDYNIQNGVHVYPHTTSTLAPVRGGSESTIKPNTTATPLSTITEISASPTQPVRGSGGSLSSSFSVIYSIPGAHSNHTKIEIGMKGDPSIEGVEIAMENVKINFVNATEIGLGPNSNVSTPHVMSAEEYLAWINAPPPNRPSNQASVIDNHRNPTSPQSASTRPTPHLDYLPVTNTENKETQTESQTSSNLKSDSAIITYSRYPTPNSPTIHTRHPPSIRQDHVSSTDDKRKESLSLLHENKSSIKSSNRKSAKDPMIREDAQVKDINENFSADFIFNKNHYYSLDPDFISNTPDIFSSSNGQKLFTNFYENSLKIPVDFDLDSSSKIAEEPSFNSVIEGEVPFKERARAIKFDTPLNQHHQLNVHHLSKGLPRDENKSNEPSIHFTPDSPSHRGHQDGIKSEFPHSSQNFNSETIVDHLSSANFDSAPVNEKPEALQVNPFSYEYYNQNGPPLPPHFGPYTLPPTVLKPPRIEPHYSDYSYSPENEEPIPWPPPSVRYYGAHHSTLPESFQTRHRYFPRPPVGFQSIEEEESEYPSASSYTHSISSHDLNSQAASFRSQGPFHFQQYPAVTTRAPKSSSRPFPLSLLPFGQKSEGSSFSLKRDKLQTSESRLPRLFPFLANRFTSTQKRYTLPTHLRAPPQNQNPSAIASNVAARRTGNVDNSISEIVPDNVRRSSKGPANGAPKRQPSKLPNSFSSRSVPSKLGSIKLPPGRSGEDNPTQKSYKRPAPSYSQTMPDSESEMK